MVVLVSEEPVVDDVELVVLVELVVIVELVVEFVVDVLLLATSSIVKFCIASVMRDSLLKKPGDTQAPSRR